MDRTQFYRHAFLSLAILLSGMNVSSASACGTGTCEKLQKAGLSEEFIRLISAKQEESEARKIVEMNVLGFLGKADYSAHYSARAVSKCKEFLRKYRKTFSKVEKRYGVPKEVIAALLWVETKHGKYLGSIPVGAAYYSLAHADAPEMIAATYEAGVGRAPAYAGLKEKVEQRSATKAAWAIDQLKALEKMHQQGRVNVRKLKGSYAGAFGIPQFIPSSYLEWGKSSQSGAKADLFRSTDAITSVAHYLHSNGWKAAEKESHRAALYHYNRADGYVDVILKIASAI